MVRTNQGGSILNFIIVGVVLALLVVGGAYFIRQKTRVAPEQVPAPAPTTVTPPETDHSKDSDSTNKQPVPSTGSEKKQPSSRQQSTPAASDKSAKTKELPHTGPVQSLSTILGLGVLSYVAVAYVRSRRALTLTSLL